MPPGITLPGPAISSLFRCAADFCGAHDRVDSDPSPCPPGVCDCGRDALLQAPGSDLRILCLNRQEEKRLLERLENIQSLDELQRLQQRLYENLGIRLSVEPGYNEVRTMRGIAIEFQTSPACAARFASRFPPPSAVGWKNAPKLPGDCWMLTICFATSEPRRLLPWSGTWA